ncbi:MAG: sensor histidine kinase [Acidobacteriota bacterium]
MLTPQGPECTPPVEQAEQLLLQQATERATRAFLSSIANELRTPLVSIMGALSSLRQDGAPLDEETRQDLIENAAEEAERLNGIVGNLIDIARVETGAIELTLSPCDVMDVIGSALQRLNTRLKERLVDVRVPPVLPLVPMDFTLMVKVLVHLLDNAVQYSAPDTPILVQAHTDGDCLEISVADRGFGIPPDDLTRVFDRFYRVPRSDSGSGIGLGLAICKGILTAHGGSIRADHREGGGTIITMTLPQVTTRMAICARMC